MQPLAHEALPVSSLDGILWPALPGGEGARMLALQFQLAQSERWPAQMLRAAQFAQLTLLLRHARASVPFYRERLAGLDLSGPLTPEAFSALPLLRRQDLQDRFADLCSTAVPPDHGQVHEGQTSGSTGRPVRFRATELNGLYWRSFTLRDHLWHHRDFSGKLAVVRGRVKSGESPGWGPSTDTAFRTGPSVTRGVDCTVAEQAQWLAREKPQYLLTLPANAGALANHCAARGIRFPGLRELRTYGESLPPDLRSQVMSAWGVPLTDLYSCSELGYLALQCPGREHYHVQAEGVYLELLDAEGNHCAPGESGRVVVTSLHNFAMPLIRYDLGDYAEAGEDCSCGRSLPVIRRILGRVRNMLRLPGGGLRSPRFGEAQFAAIAPVRQFQVVQRSLEDIEVLLVVARALTAAEESALRELILRNLGHPFSVRFSYRDDIPRTASGKYEEFRSEVSA
ncbi:MAG: phenylacetate--CoA ligase family protein [Burkholderiales bacterium]|jgi:phenylacetate-CoA ligase|nr:phenylacetate--CoA ligase family protein [Burkholderiales bacterium]